MMRMQGPWQKPPPPGPWDRPKPKQPVSRLRFYVWIAVLVGGGLALWGLSRAFPNSGDSAGWNETWMVRNVAILALVSGTIVSSRAFKVGEMVRNGAIWVAIAGVLLLGYAYQ